MTGYKSLYSCARASESHPGTVWSRHKALPTYYSFCLQVACWLPSPFRALPTQPTPSHPHNIWLLVVAVSPDTLLIKFFSTHVFWLTHVSWVPTLFQHEASKQPGSSKQHFLAFPMFSCAVHLCTFVRLFIYPPFFKNHIPTTA